MINFRTGSQAHRLISLLSVVQEFPVYSLHLLGNSQSYRRFVRKASDEQELRNCQTGAVMKCRLFTISGHGKSKTIRLHRTALPILRWICDEAYDYYMRISNNHHFSGEARKIERNHRVAESVAVFMKLGYEVRPYKLPAFSSQYGSSVRLTRISFYNSRPLKNALSGELNKTQFTRMVGALFADDQCFAVYNTRGSVMRWSGMGEFKALTGLKELCKINCHLDGEINAILLGQSYSVALETLVASDESSKPTIKFDSVYKHIYFIPMNEFGYRLMRIITLPDSDEILRDMLFNPEDHSNNLGQFEYDAFVDGVYVLSHLNGDIARLIRFKQAISEPRPKGKFEVLCFPEQAWLVKEYVGEYAAVKTIDMSLIESELGMEEFN